MNQCKYWMEYKSGGTAGPACSWVHPLVHMCFDEFSSAIVFFFPEQSIEQTLSVSCGTEIHHTTPSIIILYILQRCWVFNSNSLIPHLLMPDELFCWQKCCRPSVIHIPRLQICAYFPSTLKLQWPFNQNRAECRQKLRAVGVKSTWFEMMKLKMAAWLRPTSSLHCNSIWCWVCLCSYQTLVNNACIL